MDAAVTVMPVSLSPALKVQTLCYKGHILRLPETVSNEGANTIGMAKGPGKEALTAWGNPQKLNLQP